MCLRVTLDFYFTAMSTCGGHGTKIFLTHISLLLIMCMGEGHIFTCPNIEVSKQLGEISYVLPPHGSQEWNLGHSFNLVTVAFIL